MTAKPQPPRESWESLIERAQPESVAVPDQDTDEELVFRALSDELLEWLKRRYIEFRDPERASEPQLRESEAKRRLVYDLERMSKRGAEIAAARAKAKAKS